MTPGAAREHVDSVATTLVERAAEDVQLLAELAAPVRGLPAGVVAAYLDVLVAAQALDEAALVLRERARAL